METILTNIVAAVNDVLWNKYLLLLFLLLGSGVFFTIRTNFVQVRKFGEGMRLDEWDDPLALWLAECGGYDEVTGTYTLTYLGENGVPVRVGRVEKDGKLVRVSKKSGKEI